MKKSSAIKKSLIFITIILCFCSCSRYVLSVAYIDYISVTKDFNNFFLTESNSVNFNYETLGRINVMELPGYFESKISNDKNDLYKADIKFMGKQAKKIEVTPETTIRCAVNYAVKMGGNGIINLNIENLKDGYIVTGMVIKK